MVAIATIALVQRSILVRTENTMKPTIYAPFLSLVALAACNNLSSPVTSVPPGPTFAVIRAQGDSLTVADTLNKFRAALGGSLNAPNSPPTDSGRREINWDGVPADFTNVDTFPATFFNVNSKRGVLMSTPGTGLRVDSSAFASINAGLADQFKAFSPKKLFMAVGSNQVEVDFVARVLITSGEAALSATVADLSASGTKDLVVMDDFVYGEPRPLP